MWPMPTPRPPPASWRKSARSPAALPSSILVRRPDIGAAEAALRAAAYDTGVARARMFPDISLTGLLGSVSPELAQLFSGPVET